MSTYQTEAIILKRENIGEADRSYIIYSKDFGKLCAIAGGVRKITAKLTGHLEPFNLIWLELATKKNGQITITTALSLDQLIQSPHPAHGALMVKIADLIDRMLVEPQKDDTLWRFIAKTLIDVNKVAAGQSDLFFNNFRKEFLQLLGYGDNFEVAWHYLGDFM